MTTELIIQKLKQLENKLVETQLEIHSLQTQLEQVAAPAPSGDTTDELVARVINKRQARFYKQKPK